MDRLASPASFENIASRANARAISASQASAASGTSGTSGTSAEPVACPIASPFVLRKGGSTDPIILIVPADIRT